MQCRKPSRQDTNQSNNQVSVPRSMHKRERERFASGSRQPPKHHHQARTTNTQPQRLTARPRGGRIRRRRSKSNANANPGVIASFYHASSLVFCTVREPRTVREASGEPPKPSRHQSAVSLRSPVLAPNRRPTPCSGRPPHNKSRRIRRGVGRRQGSFADQSAVSLRSHVLAPNIRPTPCSGRPPHTRRIRRAVGRRQGSFADQTKNRRAKLGDITA
jgi:hypothetical protein